MVVVVDVVGNTNKNWLILFNCGGSLLIIWLIAATGRYVVNITIRIHSKMMVIRM